MNYRREIDGLRAFAVLVVIVFHAGFPWASGGYIGVDIFFVISGYLITSIILKEIAEDRFTIFAFYERRIRRIMPALTLVLFVTVPLAWLWLLPDQFAGFARSLLSVIFFVSNIYLQKQTGYFAGAADEKPLLHMWSLSVEEQYYLLFPPTVLLVWRYRQRLLVPVLSALAVLSLGFAEWSSTRHPETIFFDTRGRVWELLCGSLLACFVMWGRKKPFSRVAAEVGAMLGLALIVLAVFAFNKKTPFPGLYGLVPVLGTAAIILFATSETLVGRLLGTKPLVGIGLISYSAYLWHQPLLAFARARSIGAPTQGLMLALILLSLVLAYFSWRFVEQPFRDRSRFALRTVAGVLAWSCAGLVLAGVGISFWGGVPARYKNADADLLVSHEERSDYVQEYYAQLQKLTGPYNSENKRLLVVGDSYAQDLVNMLRETGAFPDYDIRTVYVPTRCQLYIGGDDVSKFRTGRAWSKHEEALIVDTIQGYARQADVVLITALWKSWSVERLPQTLSNIALREGARLFVIGRKSFGASFNRAAFTNLTLSEKAAVRVPLGDEHVRINALMRKNLAAEVFIDINALICGDFAIESPVFTPQGELMSYDGAHLTPCGARYVGELLKQHPLLAPYWP